MWVVRLQHLLRVKKLSKISHYLLGWFLEASKEIPFYPSHLCNVLLHRLGVSSASFFAVHVLIASGSILVRLTVLRLSRLEVFSHKQNTKQETESFIVLFLRIRIFEKVNVRILVSFLRFFHKTMAISHQRLYCILIFVFNVCLREENWLRWSFFLFYEAWKKLSLRGRIKTIHHRRSRTRDNHGRHVLPESGRGFC